MYARLISFSGADPEKRDSAIEMIRGTVIPMLQNYDGFAGYISLYNADDRRAKAIILWESKDTADAAEETLAERRVKMVDQVGLTIESVDLYEAPVVELEAARAWSRFIVGLGAVDVPVASSGDDPASVISG